MLICLSCYQYVEAQTLYVDVAATGSNNGSSWTNAFTDLQDALDSNMAGNVDTILLAQGTYYPTESPDGTTSNSRDRAFHLADSNVVILAGYDASSGSLTSTRSILSGDLVSAGTSSDSAYHVLLTHALTSSSVFSNLIIRDGKANGTDSIVYESNIIDRDFGGGVHNFSSSPTFSNTLIIGNSALSGGGMFNTYTSLPKVQDVVFDSNSSANQGGAVFNALFSSPSLYNTLFTNNSSAAAGAMFNYFHSSPTLMGCSFVANSATSGGAIANSTASKPIIYNSLFFKNVALVGKSILNADSSINPLSTNNAMDSDSSLFFNSKLSLYGLSYSQLFKDSTTLVGADGIWMSADDALRLIAESSLRAGGDASKSLYTDITGSSRPDIPAIGAYEYHTCEAAGSKVYVDVNASGNNSGTSWANAFTSLQSAFDLRMSCLKVDTILVAEGIYYPPFAPDRSTSSDKNKAFHLSDSNVVVIGGYDASTGLETVRNTEINGDLAQGGLGSDSVFHLLITTGLDTNSIFKNFVFSAGNANDNLSTMTFASESFFNGFGGACFNVKSNPRFYTCVFDQNRAFYGAAVANDQSSPKFYNCAFVRDTVTAEGGAVYNLLDSDPSFVHCTFMKNQADYGGAFSSKSSSMPYFLNCCFFGNQADSAGNVVHNDSNSGVSSSSTHNALDYDLDSFSNTKVDLSSTYYRQLLVDSVDFWGTDSQRLTADDGLHLLPLSPLIDLGSSTAGISIDATGNQRSAVPDIGNLEYSPCNFKQRVLYVDAQATGLRTGRSWANAYVYLQNALDARMECDGIDTILVASGLHYPSEPPDDSRSYYRYRAFHLADSNVVIIGGYNSSTGIQSGDTTILSGDLVTAGAGSDSAHHVMVCVRLDSSSHFSNLRIAHGKADTFYFGSILFAGLGVDLRLGGGLYNILAHPRLTNIQFVENYSYRHGGAMYNYICHPPMQNLEFTGNSSAWGGAIYNYKSHPRILDSKFTSNAVTISGGAIANDESSPTLLNDTFSLNTSGGDAGAIDNSVSSPNIKNSVFSNNSAGTDGGAITNHSSAPIFEKCIFSKNTSTARGGAFFNSTSGDPLVKNCLFAGNHAKTDGGAMYMLAAARFKDLKIISSTFISNIADDEGGAFYLNNADGGKFEVNNSVFYNNSDASGASVLNLDASSIVSTNSSHNAMDADSSLLPNTKIDLYTSSFATLFQDSIELKGPDSLWMTKDDAYALTSSSILYASGDSANSASDDIVNFIRPESPSVGAYEFHGCSAKNRIPTISDSTYSSAIKTTDDSSWSHYCTSNGELLLSLFLGSGNAAVDSNQVRLKLGASTTYSTSSYGNFITNTDGYAMIDRRWDVSPTTNNSVDSIGIRYYFTNNEYNDVVSALAAKSTTISAVTDLQMYKLTSGVAFADPHQESGFVIFNDTISNTLKWKYSVHNTSNHMAAFSVASFSGGGGGASGGGGGALPVELVEFAVMRHDESTALLTWQTASELNNKLFDIERYNSENKKFEKRGEVIGAGNSQELENYSFLDDISEMNSRICYRLKQVDFNGSYDYSELKCISKPTRNSKIFIYPNPSTGTLRVNVPETDAIYTVKLVSIYGQQVQEQTIEADSTIDLHSIGAGTYMLEVYEDSTLLFVRKMVINH